MWAFQYKHGDRPLEGYTIQRAAGRGGFGEVYYAVSDSGREVALKVVQGYEQIELRGISQCMNLKSPHLVSIFDVRHNAENKPFVIMEFVSGPNLRQILDESPAGIGTQKAAFFLREIAKGLSFLHDCGIVHRDLKPANIFYENGYVKIGDYGLSKAMAASQHSGQTVTVGTVHYMAPEIGAGKYDRSIDIYALGAVLFEMLTGTPPYLGASASEVLMKHLSSEPDTSGIPQPFARVIKKAMARDPLQRYQHVQEMVEDVFGAEHVRQSVSVFSPEDLSVVAERVAKRATVAVGGGGSSMPPGAGPRQGKPDVWQRLGGAFDRVGDRFSERFVPGAGRIDQIDPFAGAPAEVHDPLQTRHRWTLAILVSVIAGVAGTVVSLRAMGPPIVSILFIFTCAWGTAAGVFVAARTLLPRMHAESPFMQKLVVGMIAAGFGLMLSLPTWASTSDRYTGGTLLAVLLPLFLIDTRKWHAPDRCERVRFGKIFAAGLCAFILAAMAHGNKNVAIATLASTCMLVQILAPWDPIAGARTKEREEAGEEDEESSHPGRLRARDAAKSSSAMPPMSPTPPMPPVPGATALGSRYAWTPVWRFARLFWLAGTVVFVTMGVMFCVAGGLEHNPLDRGPLVAAGVGALMLAVFSFLKSFQRRSYGRWSYFFRPVIMALCLVAIVASIIVMGTYPTSFQADEAVTGAFFIVFPAMTFFVMLFVTGRQRLAHLLVPPPEAPPTAPAAQAAWVGGSGSAAAAVTPIAPLYREISSSPAPSHTHRPDWTQWFAEHARRRRERVGGLFGALAGFLIFASVVLGLAIALDIPGMLQAGLPDPKFAQDLQQKVFVGVSDWPRLMKNVLAAAAAVTTMLAVVILIFALANGGVMHMIRGVIAPMGLLVTLMGTSHLYARAGTWDKIAEHAHAKQFGAATDLFCQPLQSGSAIWTGIVLLMFLILLAWPAPRPRQPKAMAFALAPSPAPAPQAPSVAPSPSPAPAPSQHEDAPVQGV